MTSTSSSPSAQARRAAVDIGSTVVKVALVDDRDHVISQTLHGRDFELGIAKQVMGLLAQLQGAVDLERVLVCSSANGGLRVGIVCLSQHFSGATMRNQVLLAGANPTFVHDLEEPAGSLERVDVLLVGGGIDCADAVPLKERLERFDPSRYRFGTLVFAGNCHLASEFVRRFPQAIVIPNPLATGLESRKLSVFDAIRRAYLDDLVYKEGVSELGGTLASGIRPTPEIVSRGFQRALAQSSGIEVSGACVVLDIGGATTDLHYTVEIVRDESEAKPAAGLSVARYVFVDLGIVASRDSLLLQLRTHPRLYEFLKSVLDGEVEEPYRLMREGAYDPSPELLSYGCLFVALDRFSQGRGPGLPAGDLGRIAQIILTGGSSQTLSEEGAARVFELFRVGDNPLPSVLIDRMYQLWIDGITWSGNASL
jgi:hypothetical protein